MRLEAIAAASALILVTVAFAAPDIKYVEPNIEALQIRSNMLLIPATARSKIASDLTGFVCRGAPLTPAYMQESAKLLGLALLLDSTNRAAVLANVRLRSGKAPPEVTLRKTAAQLSEVLRLEAKERLKPISRDDAFLGGYFLMLATELSPENENAAYDYEMFKQKSLKLSWDGLLGKMKEAENPQALPAAAPKAAARAEARLSKGTHPEFADREKPFARRQSSVKGLFVQTTATGMQTGQALDIIGSILSFPDPKVTNCRFAQVVGPQMETSWDEAVRVLQMRYPYWEGGKQVSISFSDKYSPKDGGSAGMALSLLLFSLLEGFELDPNFAVTGDITVDWKVREVGGIPTKVRGAILDKCTSVVIPKINEGQLQDAVILDSLKQLWAIQVFAVEDLGEAVMTVRTDRSADLAKAMGLFAQVQTNLNINGSAGLRSAENNRILAEVCRLAPQHASAALLLKAANGKMTNKLTLGGSVEETVMNMAPLMPYLLAPDRYRITDKLPVSADLLKTSTGRLQKLRPNMDARAQGLCANVVEYLRAVEEYVRAREMQKGPRLSLLAENKLKVAQTTADKVRKELTNLQQDRSFIEALGRP
jgi:hypothetical protein